jgi:hypothetical protein
MCLKPAHGRSTTVFIPRSLGTYSGSNRASLRVVFRRKPCDDPVVLRGVVARGARRLEGHQTHEVVIVSRPSWLGDQEALTYWGLADPLARLSSQLRFECPDQWWPVWSFTKGPRTGPLAPV